MYRQWKIWIQQFLAQKRNETRFVSKHDFSMILKSKRCWINLGLTRVRLHFYLLQNLEKGSKQLWRTWIYLFRLDRFYSKNFDFMPCLRCHNRYKSSISIWLFVSDIKFDTHKKSSHLDRCSKAKLKGNI